jgi:hypothetical protein
LIWYLLSMLALSLMMCNLDNLLVLSDFRYFTSVGQPLKYSFRLKAESLM